MNTKHTPNETSGVTNPCSEVSPEIAVGHYGYEIVEPNKGLVDSSFPAYRLHYVIKGSVTLYFNNESITLKKNSVFLLMPDTNISYQSNHKRYVTELYWVTFNGYKAKHYSNEIGLTEDHPYLVLPNEKIMEYFYENYKIKNYSDSMKYLVLQTNLFKIFNVIYTERNKQQGLDKLPPPSNNLGIQNNMQIMLQYINDNLTSPNLSIKLFAEKFYMHPSTLSRLFKKHTSVCFTEYVTIKRIEHAIPLLQSGELKINEIARIVGFEDPLYFSRVFRKKFKCSPSDVVKKYNPKK